MKKLAITLSAAMLCSVMSVCAAPTSPVTPVNCPVKASPCPLKPQSEPCAKPCEAKVKPCDSCAKTECEPKCEPAPVFNTCEEIQEWKIKYFEKRCDIYSKLGLSQEQRVKAKCVDEKWFDEIAPLKMCCKQEKAKLKEMECKKCSRKDIRAQKEKIKDLKAEIKDKKKQHKECFTALLSQCQKDQYKTLSKEKCKKHDSDKCDCGCK